MVTIIICSYNDKEDLLKTVASCLVQEFFPQIIVVNDASIKRWNEWDYEFMALLGVKYTENKTNLGLAESRDVGIGMAATKYIIPLDCGDFFYPHVLGKMVLAMKDADVVFGNMDEKDGGRICVPDGKRGVTREGMLSCNQLWCTSMFRKSLWEKVGGYKNGLHTSYEDYTFFNKCLMAGARFKYLDLLVYRHTYNPHSMLSELHAKTDYYKEIARRPLCQ